MSQRRQFGENIRGLRRSRELTQEGLAERATLSVDAVRRVELGTMSPSLNTLRKIAAGLDVSMPTLFSTLESGRRDDLAELFDFLSDRPRKEIRIVFRLARVVLSPKRLAPR